MGDILLSNEKFSVSAQYAGVANGTSVYFEFKTPVKAKGKAIHLNHIELYLGGKTTIEVLEAPGLTTGETAVVPTQCNRLSATILSDCVLKSNPTLVVNGTVIAKHVYSAGFNKLPDDLVLEQNTTYVIKLTNGSGGAIDIDLFLKWLEDDK